MFKVGDKVVWNGSRSPIYTIRRVRGDGYVLVWWPEVSKNHTVETPNGPAYFLWQEESKFSLYVPTEPKGPYVVKNETSGRYIFEAFESVEEARKFAVQQAGYNKGWTYSIIPLGEPFKRVTMPSPTLLEEDLVGTEWTKVDV